MSSLNVKKSSVTPPRLAGGTGGVAAIQSSIQTLRRLTLANLLWEDTAYVDGQTVAQQIAVLVPGCDPVEVGKLALEIREKQGLRHVPLLLVREMFRNPASRKEAGKALFQVIQRADEITEFVSLYWKDGKIPLPAQMKKALSDAFCKFDEYQLAKYKDSGKGVSLRDVMHLVHAKPKNVPSDRLLKWDKATRKFAFNKQIRPGELTPQEVLYAKVSNQELATPQTREVLLSAAKSQEEKKAAYTQLLQTNKLGTMALLKNLRAMDQLGVETHLVAEAMGRAKHDKILPLQFFSAYQHAPKYKSQLNVLMQACMKKYSSLKGRTIFFIDVSGSMHSHVSSKSEYTRQDAATALAVMAREICEEAVIYMTAGSDLSGVHKTLVVPSDLRGFDLWDYVRKTAPTMGGGGIFTRQALEYAYSEGNYDGKGPERIIVVSDSQDMDRFNKKPAPFGKYNYIADVSCIKNGINFKGVWTQEISGWSQHLVEYIAQCEAGYQAQLF